LTPDALETLLLQQVGSLAALARSQKVPLHHVKLHGALYHASETDPRLARAYLDAMRTYWPACVVFARAGGRVARLGRLSGVRVWEELFADRGYQPDGSLIDRRAPGALLTCPADVVERIRRLREQGEVVTSDGTAVPLRARTICVHGDTPHAVALAKAVRCAIDPGHHA
jgi:UPF0271 protein